MCASIVDDDTPCPGVKHKARVRDEQADGQDRPAKRARKGSRLLSTHCPQLYKELHPTKNTGIDVTRLTMWSKKRVWWSCSNCKLGHHVWQAAVYSRVRGTGCRFCGGKETCPCDSLGGKHPELLQEFVDAGNRREDAFTIPCGSGRAFPWKCRFSKCPHHVFEARVCDRTGGTGCPFCAGHQTCHCDSFGSLHPKLLEEFEAAGNSRELAFALAPFSNQKFEWSCTAAKCTHHRWQASVCDRTYGSSCPFCAGHSICRCNSFGALFPDLVPEFVAGGNLLEEAFRTGPKSNHKVWWKSSCDHAAWETSIVSRTRLGSGCPYCRYKSEQSCREILEDLLAPHKFKKKRPKWLAGLELDGYCKTLKLAFEYNGQQHYQHVVYFHRDEKDFHDQQDRDALKRTLVAARSVALLEIPYMYNHRNRPKLETFISDWLQEHGYLRRSSLAQA